MPLDLDTGKRAHSDTFTTLGTLFAGVEGDTPTYGPMGADLVGSADPDDPRSGLAAEITAALEAGRACLDVTGAWTMDGEVEFSSGSLPIDHVPTIVDARAACIEYGGDGWLFTNDNTRDAGCALRGENFQLYGGFWLSTGDPDGFVRIVDSGGCRLYPNQTRGWTASGKDAVVYQLEEGERWCESNQLGGRHHLLDVGIRSTASRGTSFQDTLIDSIHLSQCTRYGFDLSGNWIDCTFLNPTLIVCRDDAAFLRMNGNMSGAEIIAPELEDAGNDLDNFYLCEVGPRAAAGPSVRGGELGLEFNSITLFETGEAPPNWSFRMDYARDHRPVRSLFGGEGATRTVMDYDGVHRQAAPFERGDWMPVWETEARL